MPKTKNGNGEGTIRKRPDGRYEARYTVSFPDGRKVQRSAYGRTRQQAFEKMQTERAKSPTAVEVGSQTLKEYLIRWMEQTARPHIRDSTYQSYAAMVNGHLIPALGRIRLDALTPEHIEDLLNAKREAGLSSSTVRYIRSVLRIALGVAVRRRHLPFNPAQLVDPPPLTRDEVKPLSLGQFRRFLETLDGTQLGTIVTVAAGTGLRQGELLGLRWSNVDLVQGWLSVTETLQWRDRRPELGPPKTAKSIREVPVPAFAAAALTIHRERQQEAAAGQPDGWNSWDLVFCSERGTPLDPKNVTHRVQTALARSNLPRQRFHDFRHAYLSELARLGVDPTVRRDAAGHTESRMTDHYTHTRPLALRAAATRLNRAFERASFDPNHDPNPRDRRTHSVPSAAV